MKGPSRARKAERTSDRSSPALTGPSALLPIPVALAADRFVVLGLALLVVMAAQASRGFWIGDFWQHAACLRELILHPFSPSHPQFALQAPSAFFSPYLVAVALAAKAAGLGAMKALPLAGLFNLGLLLFAMRAFVAQTFPDESADSVSFYFLLFMLVLWGRDPWVWSSFFQGVLGDSLPYPSTFAMALTFGALALYQSWQKNSVIARLAAVSAATAAVFLTHPSTGITLCVLLLAFELGRSPKVSGPGLAALFGALVAALLLACAWPYYPFKDLLTGSQSAEFHANSRVLYEHVLARTWPASIGLYALWLRRRENRRDPLLLAAGGLALVYVYGWASGLWGYGRSISHLVIILQLAAAQWAARLEKRSPLSLGYAALLGGTLYGAWGFRSPIREAFAGSKYSYENSPILSKLPELAGPRDVIFSDAGTNWVVPAFAGRVVSYDWPLYWVPDLAQRRADTALFFAKGTACVLRAGLLKKYDAKYLLLNGSAVPMASRLVPLLRRWGDQVYSDNNFLMVRLKSSLACP